MYLHMLLLHCRLGTYLSKEEVAKLVVLCPYTLKLVHSWLAHHGLLSSFISTTPSSSWLTLTDMPVSQANQLLCASYQVYRHARMNDNTIFCMVGYALPTVLHTHVQTVVLMTYFTYTHMPPVREAVALAKVGLRELLMVLLSRNEPEVVTPEYLSLLYKTVTYVPTMTNENFLGAVGFLDQYTSLKDLMRFMIVFHSDAVDATFTIKKVNNGRYDPSNPGPEANLNMQYA